MKLMREFTEKIKEKLKDGIQTILSDYRVEMALKIAAVVAGIACVAAVGYGIYKYHYYRGEIVWTDHYKLEDVKEDEVVMYTMFEGGGWDTRVYLALMDKGGRVKVIDDAVRNRMEKELGEWEGTDIELYDYFMQNEDIPYEEETIKVSDEVLTNAINIEEIELTYEFSGYRYYPGIFNYVIHGTGNERKEVLIAEFGRSRQENRRKELKPVLKYTDELAAKLPY